MLLGKGGVVGKDALAYPLSETNPLRLLTNTISCGRVVSHKAEPRAGGGPSVRCFRAGDAMELRESTSLDSPRAAGRGGEMLSGDPPCNKRESRATGDAAETLLVDEDDELLRVEADDDADDDGDDDDPSDDDDDNDDRLRPRRPLGLAGETSS